VRRKELEGSCYGLTATPIPYLPRNAQGKDRRVRSEGMKLRLRKRGGKELF